MPRRAWGESIARAKPAALGAPKRPEYLHIVGWFQEDVPRANLLVAGLLRTLQAVLPEVAVGTGAVARFSTATRPSAGLVDPQWRHDIDLTPESGRWNLVIRREPDPLSTIESSALIPADVRLDLASVGDEQEVANGRADGWRVRYCAERRYPQGQEDCLCMLSVPTDLFPRREQGVVRRLPSNRLVDAVIGAFAAHGSLYYAMAKASPAWRDNDGMAYTAGSTIWPSLQDTVDAELWLQAGEARRDHVRGLYAAQFLSPRHLERLGGRAEFVGALVSECVRARPLVADLGEFGIILRLSESAIDDSDRGANWGSNAATWVYRRFRRVGLFVE